MPPSSLLQESPRLPAVADVVPWTGREGLQALFLSRVMAAPVHGGVGLLWAH